MTRLNRVLTTVENLLAAGSLAAAVFIAFIAILLRETMGVFLFWSEEAVIYLVIVSTFLGAVVTLRHQEHVNVEIISLFLKRRGKRVMALIGAVVTLAYLAIVGYFAWMLLFEPFSTATVTPALKLPLWVVEIGVPIGFTLMFLRTIELLVRMARGQEDEQHAKQSALEAEADSIGLDMTEVRAVRDESEGPHSEGGSRGNEGTHS
jgi:C4-dicarboxylate transporter DctQ subunit